MEKKAEEEMQQQEVERKKREEEVLDKKRKEAEEIQENLKKERPGHIKELLALDLEVASAGQMMKMMRNLGINSVGCVEKQDLKIKLIESIPELRIKMASKSQESTIKLPSSELC